MRKLTLIFLAIISIALSSCGKSEAQKIYDETTSICETNNVVVLKTDEGFDTGITKNVAKIADKICDRIDNITGVVGEYTDVHNRYGNENYLSVTKKWETSSSRIELTMDSNKKENKGSVRVKIHDKTL